MANQLWQLQIKLGASAMQFNVGNLCLPLPRLVPAVYQRKRSIYAD